MRELTVRIRFIKHSLGNVKVKKTGRFSFARTPATGAITFLSTWHVANLRFASQILGRHQEEVKKTLWDINIDGVVEKGSWFRRFYTVSGTEKQRYALHESFKPGQIIGINCIVPETISDDDFWELMRIAGQYRGLSPARPGEFGHFDIVSIRPRRRVEPEGEDKQEPEKPVTPPTLA